ncbi:hypothetical protein [Paenibacillus yonginensis]|uniref:hypothetical protein n=1 Tax=Paenibacillus yonginensis TaxID=1462996 RepID=UPI00147203F1|nr:hypothetical protein [Paenibacillus yonginensis]
MIGSDLDAKKTFVSEKVHKDVQSIFQLGASQETSNSSKLNNPVVVKSSDYTDGDGGKDKLILIQGEKPSNPASELIVLIIIR